MFLNDIKYTSIPKSLDSKLVEWMKNVYEAMDVKEWLAFDEDEELYNIIERGREYSCLALDTKNDCIAGIFLVNFYDIEDSHFYGHYCNLSMEELKQTAVMDIAMVDPSYRGMKIMLKTMDYVERKLTDSSYKFLLATVHPENVFSYNNLIKCGYKVTSRQSLYGGLDRYILLKDIYY